MRALAWLLLLAVATTATAQGRGGTGEGSGVGVSQDGVRLPGLCERLELPSGSWQAPTKNGATCTIIPTGGGGGGTAKALIAWSSGMPLDGSVPVFLGTAGLDQVEGAAQLCVKNAVTFGQMRCQLSDTTGAQTLTITGRKGAAGSLADTVWVCTIGAGQASCTSGATSMAVLAGECMSLKAQANSALPGVRWLNCTGEASS